jgi:hypothetical protein
MPMFTFKWNASQLSYIFVLLLLGFLSSYAVVRSGNVMTLGSDGLTHFYQAETLKAQISSDNPLLSGSWNWNWYNGYTFLRAYSPLYHYVVAITSVAFGIPTTTSIFLIVLFSYPLLALVAYLFAYKITQNRLSSFVIAMLYLSVPAFLTEIAIGGMMPRLLTYILSPLSFYLLEKLSSAFNFKTLIYATITLAAGFLANFGYFVNIVLFVTLVLLLKYFLVQKFSLKVFMTIPLSVLLSSAILLPQIYYIFNIGSPYFGPSRPVEFENLTSSFTWLIFQIGLPFFFVLLSLPVFTLNLLHHRDKARRLPYLPYVIAFAVALILFSLGLIVGEFSSSLNLITGKAMIFPLALLSPVVGSYAISQAKRKRVFVLFLVVLVTFSNTSLAPLYYWHIPSPEGLADDYALLKQASTTFEIPLFTDDFSQNRTSDWKVISGTWSISNGTLKSSGEGTEQILTLDKNWTNCILSVRAKWGLGSVGLIFRAKDENNSYILNVDHSSNDASLIKILNGTSEKLESAVISSVDSEWYKLKVEVHGDEIQCSISNTFLFSFKDDTFQEGLIGIESSNAYAVFDKVEVGIRSIDEQKWFRVLSLPQYPRMLVAQMLYGNFPSPDGWFDQGAERENLNLIRYAQSLLADKPEEALRILGIFNVRYVVLDESDPVFSGYLSDTIARMKNSTSASLIFQHGGLYVFELDETYPLISSTNVFVIDADDEISAFKDIILNETFVPTLGVFLSKSNDLEGISWKRWNWSADYDVYANLTVNQIRVTNTRMEFDLTVNRSSFISIPISYLPGLRTEVDGQEVRMFKALPAFIAVEVSAGTHSILISRYATSLENASAIVSAAVLVGLLTLLIVNFVRRKVKKRVESISSDSNIQQMQ